MTISTKYLKQGEFLDLVWLAVVETEEEPKEMKTYGLLSILSIINMFDLSEGKTKVRSSFGYLTRSGLSRK